MEIRAMMCVSMHNDCICMCVGHCLNQTKPNKTKLFYFNNSVDSQTHIFPKKTIPTLKIVTKNFWEKPVMPFPESESFNGVLMI